MSIRVTGRALKSTVAIAAILAGAAALSGCTALGARAFGDPTVTGSTAAQPAGDLNQPMPTILGSSNRVAAGPYVPPNDIGANGMPLDSRVPISGGSASVASQDLPVLVSSSDTGNNVMSAQPNLAPVAVTPKTQMLGAPAASPTLSVVPQTAYTHVIQSGESLYTIARKYNVTAQAIIQANGFSSPDKIFVGQKLTIPGVKGKPVVAVTEDATQAPIVTPVKVPTTTAVIADPALLESNTPPVQQVAAVGEPKMSGADKFRWPVSGKVITDFAGTKATGINIEVPEGAAVRAAENGTVIYVGSGVEGYGNLVLIRHPNGYVSAYAHLKAMSVTKGDVVNRGDNIGQAGMTGSVSRPQLHFELRKGATPVDPMPLLAS